MSNSVLLLGDCLEIMKDIPDGSIDLILTDPPYGTTACKWDSVIPFEPMWTELKRIRKENAAVVLFGIEPFSSALRMSNIKEFKYDWIWKKKPIGFLNSKHRPLVISEIISIFHQNKYFPQELVPSGKKVIRGKQSTSVGHDGGRLKEVPYIQQYTNYPTQLLEFKSEKGFHPTQKPVSLLEYLIKTYTLEGETVLDFTMGSGSTGVAAKNLNRQFIGIEKDENYFKIAEKRIKGDIVNSPGL